jgi:hypothetical protein
MRLIDCGKWFIGTVMGNSEGLPAELNRGKSGKGLQRGQSVARSYLVYNLKGVQIWTTLWFDTNFQAGQPTPHDRLSRELLRDTDAMGQEHCRIRLQTGHVLVPLGVYHLVQP